MADAICFTCGEPATVYAETGLVDVPMCAEHFDALIRSAETRNPNEAPGVVRSCMERASYLAAASGDAPEGGRPDAR